MTDCYGMNQQFFGVGKKRRNSRARDVWPASSPLFPYQKKQEGGKGRRDGACSVIRTSPYWRRANRSMTLNGLAYRHLPTAPPFHHQQSAMLWCQWRQCCHAIDWERERGRKGEGREETRGKMEKFCVTFWNRNRVACTLVYRLQVMDPHCFLSTSVTALTAFQLI